MAQPMFAADLFMSSSISDETRAFNRELALARRELLKVPESAAAFRNRYAEASRTLSGGKPYESPSAASKHFAVAGGSIETRILRAVEPKGVLLFIHGGGWTIGAPEAQDARLEAFVAQGFTVVAPRYRLAPEFPYPAGLDDCEATARWILAEAGLFAHSCPVAIVGESAGANLAAAVALRLRLRPGVRPLSALALLYGIYDLTMTPSQRRFGDPPGMMGTSLLRWFYDNYAPESRRADPDISPLYAELNGLPPALFIVGTGDVLIDDTLFMHARWLAAANESELHLAPGGLHAFNAYPIAIARDANAAIGGFLRTHAHRHSLALGAHP